MHSFTCNICNARCNAETLDRELSTCDECGSNVRFRWIVHALSTNLFGQSLVLKDFAVRKKIRGIGMSDFLRIADVLSNRFDYKNTCYHHEPRFDIMAPPPGEKYDFDFIVASEVFEHVRPPIQTAFNNLAALLKPNGFVVFSSPWESEGDTLEHFPNLHDWDLVRLRSGYVLVNRTPEGSLETFENLDFHGGPGSVLEMRVFSKTGLVANCSAAGFTEICFAEDHPAWGIVWDDWSRGLILRKRPLDLLPATA
jgi:SAM-dependent methyltransferase